MRNLILISWHDFKNLMRNPMWLFFALGFPVVLITILGFLTKDTYSAEFTSYNYYGITIIVYFICLNCSFATNAFLEERIKKPNMRIIYTPGSDSYIYISKIISSFIFCGICNILTMVFAHYVLGVYLNGIGALLTLLIFLNLFSVSFGVLVCCIFKSELLANQFQTTIINLMAVFSGVWFSFERTGNVMKKISNLTPMKWIINLAFSIIYDNNYSGFYIAIIVLALLTVITIIACKLSFKKEDFIW